MVIVTGLSGMDNTVAYWSTEQVHVNKIRKTGALEAEADYNQ